LKLIIICIVLYQTLTDPLAETYLFVPACMILGTFASNVERGLGRIQTGLYLINQTKIGFSPELVDRLLLVFADLKVREQTNFAWLLCVGFWIICTSFTTGWTRTWCRVYISSRRGDQCGTVMAVWVSAWYYILLLWRVLKGEGGLDSISQHTSFQIPFPPYAKREMGEKKIGRRITSGYFNSFMPGSPSSAKVNYFILQPNNNDSHNSGSWCTRYDNSRR
jgi:hypothetical protein